jgi:hypothetical protein
VRPVCKALRGQADVQGNARAAAATLLRKADRYGELVPSWITWFLSTKGNEYFSEVDEEYILDRFNLTGLNAEVPQEYGRALELITDSLGESRPLRLDPSASPLSHARSLARRPRTDCWARAWVSLRPCLRLGRGIRRMLGRSVRARAVLVLSEPETSGRRLPW